jgi:hypothetical protein
MLDETRKPLFTPFISIETHKQKTIQIDKTITRNEEEIIQEEKQVFSDDEDIDLYETQQRFIEQARAET